MSGLDAIAPIQRESTTNIVADTLRTAIMYGSLPPGSQLGEVDLAARLGVSRGPLREAMQRLVQEGLLRSERHRGLFVITLDRGDVVDIYAARTAVEQAAGRMILAQDPARSAERLAKVHRQLEQAARRKNLRALSDADLRFHEAFVVESGSPRLHRAARTLLVETRMCLFTLAGGRYPSVAEILDEHSQIVAAVHTGDQALLASRIGSHLSNAAARLASAAEAARSADPAPPAQRTGTVTATRGRPERGQTARTVGR